MRLAGTMLTVTLAVFIVHAARAEATCESIRSDLTGPNVYGEHTMKELMAGAQAGNCDYAAFLSRRARDARGFVETRYPADKDLSTLAATMFKTGQDVLDTPHCRN